MPTVTIGDRTVDLSTRVVVVDIEDAAAVRELEESGLLAAGVADLGSVSDEVLAWLAEVRVPSMMSFGADQLAELAVAVVRGVRVVRVADPVAAGKVCRVLEALFDAATGQGTKEGPRR